MLASQRHLFEIPEDKALARKSHPWNISPKDFFEDVEVARDLFAELIHAESEGIALVPSASYGINVAATNLSLAKSQRFLLLEEEFPSNVYAW